MSGFSGGKAFQDLVDQTPPALEHGKVILHSWALLQLADPLPQVMLRTLQARRKGTHGVFHKPMATVASGQILADHDFGRLAVLDARFDCFPVSAVQPGDLLGHDHRDALRATASCTACGVSSMRS